MRVSAKADYALRALIEIAVRADGTAVSAAELGEAQDIPHGFLQAILADLRRADIVVSQRGQSGGWASRAAPRRSPSPTSSGPSTAPWCRSTACGPRRSPTASPPRSSQHVWIAARSSLRGVFEQVKIQDLGDGPAGGGRLAHRRRRRLAAALRGLRPSAAALLRQLERAGARLGVPARAETGCGSRAPSSSAVTHAGHREHVDA